MPVSSRVAPSGAGSAFTKFKWASKAVAKQKRRKHRPTFEQRHVVAAAGEMIYGRRHSEVEALKHQKVSLRQMVKDGVFSPDSLLKAKWDTLIVLCVIYLAFLVPFKVAFQVGNEGILLVVAILMDLLFIADVLFSFRTGFVENGVYCVDKKRIAEKYIKSWFLLDVIASAPLSFVPAGGAVDNNWVRFLKIFRLLRLTRLSRILNVWERNMVMHPGMLRLFKLFSLVILVAHWTACTWVIFGDLIGFGETIWVPSLSFEHDYTLSEKYFQALYWAFVVLFTFSTEDNKPELPSEATITIIFIITGVYMNATIIGSTSSLLASLDDTKREQQEMMQHLFSYMKNRSLPKSLQNRMRDNIMFAISRKEDILSHAVLQYLSPALRAEVADHLNAQLLNDVWLFSNCDDRLKESMSLMLVPVYYGQNQVVFEEGTPAMEMYFIKMGEVGVYCNFQAGLDSREEKRQAEKASSSQSMKLPVRSKSEVTAITVLGQGTFFGEAALIDEDGIRNATLRTLTPCELLVLERSKFLEVAEDHPEFIQEINTVASKRRKRMSIIRKKKLRGAKLKANSKKKVDKKKRQTQVVDLLRRWFDAVRASDAAAVSRMVASKKFLIDALELTDEKHTALHIAVTSNDLSMLKLLLDLGANIDAKDGKGRTPLDLETSTEIEDFFKFYTGAGDSMEPKDDSIELDSELDAGGLQRILEEDEDS